jgi:DHA1 family tetracycline resistance protein-like MFS transporter
MTRRVGPSEQGRLQGVNAAMTGVAAIAGPMIYLSLLAFSVRHAGAVPAGLAISIAAVLTGCSFLLALSRAKPAPVMSGAAQQA